MVRCCWTGETVWNELIFLNSWFYSNINTCSKGYSMSQENSPGICYKLEVVSEWLAVVTDFKNWMKITVWQYMPPWRLLQLHNVSIPRTFWVSSIKDPESPHTTLLFNSTIKYSVSIFLDLAARVGVQLGLEMLTPKMAQIHFFSLFLLRTS